VTWTGGEVAGLAMVSVAVAVRVCAPSASGADGVHDHVPESDAVAVQAAVPSALTDTVASGSLVPETVGVSLANPDSSELVPLHQCSSKPS
jgi:hypothetical protein